MVDNEAWAAREEAIARLLPGSDSHDRRRLLAELASYSEAAVGEARRRHQPECHSGLLIEEWLEHPVFVCGAHRTGTTLIQRLLDGHPEVMVLPSEATYLSSFRYVAQPQPQDRDIDRFMAEWVTRMIDPNHAPHFKLGRSSSVSNPAILFCERLLAWQEVIRASKPALASFAMLLALAAAFKDLTIADSRPRMWVEKTPRNEVNLDRLRVFGKARFIQMVRDPGATLASLQAAHRRAGLVGFEPARHIETIGRSLQVAAENASRLPDRYLVVRYEDLTRQPEAQMRRVQAFLGIAPSPSLLTPTSGRVAVASNSSFAPAAAGQISKPNGNTLPDLRHERMISALIGRAALAHGYEIAPLRRGTRLRIRLERRLMLPFRGLEWAAARLRRRKSD